MERLNDPSAANKRLLRFVRWVWSEMVEGVKLIDRKVPDVR